LTRLLRELAIKDISLVFSLLHSASQIVLWARQRGCPDAWRLLPVLPTGEALLSLTRIHVGLGTAFATTADGSLQHDLLNLRHKTAAIRQRSFLYSVWSSEQRHDETFDQFCATQMTEMFTDLSAGELLAVKAYGSVPVPFLPIMGMAPTLDGVTAMQRTAGAGILTGLTSAAGQVHPALQQVLPLGIFDELINLYELVEQHIVSTRTKISRTCNELTPAQIHAAVMRRCHALLVQSNEAVRT